MKDKHKTVILALLFLVSLILSALLSSCNPYMGHLQACYKKDRRTMEMYWGKPDYCEQDGRYGSVCVYLADGYFTEKRFYFDNIGTIYLIKTR